MACLLGICIEVDMQTHSTRAPFSYINLSLSQSLDSVCNLGLLSALGFSLFRHVPSMQVLSINIIRFLIRILILVIATSIIIIIIVIISIPLCLLCICYLCI